MTYCFCFITHCIFAVLTSLCMLHDLDITLYVLYTACGTHLPVHNACCWSCVLMHRHEAIQFIHHVAVLVLFDFLHVAACGGSHNLRIECYHSYDRMHTACLYSFVLALTNINIFMFLNILHTIILMFCHILHTTILLSFHILHTIIIPHTTCHYSHFHSPLLSILTSFDLNIPVSVRLM